MTPAPIDVDKVRADTPSCAEWTHLLHCGSSPMPDPVKAALIEHLELETRFGGYLAQDMAGPAWNDFHHAAAALLGAEPDEIAFVEHATHAWNAIVYALAFQPGDRVITCQSEYMSNILAFLHLARTKGIVIDIVPDDEHGQVDVEVLETMISDRTKLIAITHIPTQGGLVNPVARIGAVARRLNVPYLVDACQSAGQRVLDVNAIGCDYLTCTGRKFLRGPRGTGFLYVRRDRVDSLHPAQIDGQAAEWISPDDYRLADGAARFEGYERNVACQIALGVAIRYALDLGLEAIQERITTLATRYREQLGSIPGVELTDLGQERCGIVTFRKHGEQPAAIVERLKQASISAGVSGGHWGGPDFHRRGIQSVVRTAVHYLNTETEIDRVCDVIASN